jgi:glycerol-3-phosphate dehydrogenase (NAD+)
VHFSVHGRHPFQPLRQFFKGICKSQGRPLTEIINTLHENTKYLPGIKLPENLVADPDICSVVRGADILVFCTPHQFMKSILNDLKGHVKESAIAISLTKGMRVRPDGPQLISEAIRSNLRIDCSVLMGANIAAAIGREELSEATIGYMDVANATLLQKLFERPYFHVTAVPDPVRYPLMIQNKLNIPCALVGMPLLHGTA